MFVELFWKKRFLLKILARSQLVNQSPHRLFAYQLTSQPVRQEYFYFPCDVMDSIQGVKIWTLMTQALPGEPCTNCTSDTISLDSLGNTSVSLESSVTVENFCGGSDHEEDKICRWERCWCNAFVVPLSQELSFLCFSRSQGQSTSHTLRCNM